MISELLSRRINVKNELLSSTPVNTFDTLLKFSIYNLEQVAGFLKVVLKKLNFMATFHRWGSTVSRLQSNYEEKVYFLPLSRLEKHGTYLIELARMNG